MSHLPEKYSATIDEAVVHLITRAENSRGLSIADLRPRIEAAVTKYLFGEGEHHEHADIIDFIAEIRADDLCLIVACERGDEAAWSDLLANFDATVKSAARKIASNTEDAEDLASSIWAELYGLRTDADGKRKSKLAYYTGRGSLAGWLRAVVSQLAVDRYRKDAKYVQVEEDRDLENALNAAAESDDTRTAGHIGDPEDIYSQKSAVSDITEALRTAVAALDDEDRLLIKLYYFEGLKLKDIAAMFGYHEATASRRLARIQSDIRKGVEKELRAGHGWSETEVKRHLSETASGLGINLETMFAALLLAACMQEFWT